MNRFLKYGTLISTYGFIASVALQIFARFFLTKTPPWTEESARLFFIYAIAFAAGLAIKTEEYVALDIIYEKLSKRNKNRLLQWVQMTTLLLFGTMAIYAVKFVQQGIPEFSPSMGISMSIAFFSMVILSSSVAYFALRRLKKILFKKI